MDPLVDDLSVSDLIPLVEIAFARFQSCPNRLITKMQQLLSVQHKRRAMRLSVNMSWIITRERAGSVKSLLLT
jgi:hypothetical protein